MDILKEMDRDTLFFHEFCLHLDKRLKGLRDMNVFYIFTDTRPGTVIERIQADAEKFAAYQRIFTV